LFVNTTALRQQISKFYLQIISSVSSSYIFDRPLTEINVMASFCVLNFTDLFHRSHYYGRRYRSRYAMPAGMRSVTTRAWSDGCYHNS